ncbi:MAG: BACON domain-containing protein [Bacteroidales bacterium]|nr:BACON domain-containing protein [Bacteroidales bacterium]
MKKLLRNLSVLCFVLAAFLTTGCYEEEIPFLKADHEVVLVGPETGKGTVVIESNLQWTASSDVEWITVDNGFGNHKGTFEFFVAANTTPNERSGKITITSNDGIVSTTVLVRQTSEGTQLVLGKDKVSFTKYAGEYLMSIACNGPWEVASSADWCTVDPDSGDGNGAFKITVEENNTGADRVATITVLTEADGKTEVHQIEVSQSASNAALVVSPESQTLTAEAGQFTLNVTTKGTWTASVDSDWLTLSETEGSNDNLITVTATANDTGRERIAVITFTTGPENENRVTRQVVVRQAAVDFYLDVPVTDYPLSLEEQTIEIPYVLEGSNVTVTASSSSKWMTVASVADGVATINVAENTTAIAREGVISFITHGQAGDPIIRQVRVAQAPTINILDVLADEYAVEWVGETFRIPIYSNTPVSVRSSESWCNVVADGQNLVITVEKNETAVPRVAVVTVTTDSEKGEIISKTTIIRQGAAYSTLVVSPAEKNLYAIAQNFVASILTNNSWTASSDSDWLTIDKTEGTGDYMLNVNVAENKTGQVRVAVITIQTGAENSQRESATITVTQRPEQFYFEVPVRSFLFDKWGGLAKVTFVTSGNEESVVASSNVDWLRVGDIADGIVNVAVSENKTAEVRTGIVTITCTPVFGDPIAIPVTFTQSPTVNILDVFVDVIDVMARGDEVALPYYANTPVSVSSSEDWVHAEVAVDEDSYQAECCSYSDPQKIIKIEVDPNRTGEARVAFVTIATVNEAGEKITKVITIRQAALYAALSVTPKEVVIPATETEFAMTINTTGTWWATNSSDWLTNPVDGGVSTEAAGFGDAVINWTAAENTTGYDRRAQITVATGPENNEREEQVVNVIQLARDTYIEIPIAAYAVTKEEQTLEVGYFAAGDFTDMQVNCSEDWIKYTGGDATTLEFDIEENTTAEPRTAIVTVTLQLKAGEPISDTFIVTQAPTINILDVYVDYYEASPKGEVVVFPFYGNTEVSTSVSSMVGGWCSVIPGTPNQDVDPQEIAIDVKKNESAEARTAYVTLTTVTDKGEKLTHIITIHQNPLNAMLSVSPEKVVIPAHDASFWTQVITTGTWTADWSATWISPDEAYGEGDYSIKWTADDNETGLQRETTLVVWTGEENETRVEKRVQVIQLATDTYLEIPMDNFVLSKDQQTFHVAMFAAGDITNADYDYNADWLTVYEFDIESNLLGVKVQENTTAEPRTAIVTVTIERAGGVPCTESFTVTQAGTYNVLDGLSDRVVADAAGEKFTLPVITNVETLSAVVSEEGWITVQPVTVEDGYGVVDFEVAANATGKDRHASITVITTSNKGETLAKKIMVYQPAAGTYFAILSGENVLVNKVENDITVTAYASVNADKVTMIPNAAWITVKTAPAATDQIVEAEFTVAENTTGVRRQGEIIVTFFDEKGDTVQKTIVVNQAATDGGELEALVDFITVAAAGETVVLTFETEDALTATPSATWITAADIDNTTDPQTLTITAAENTTGLDRTAYISVSNGSESKIITVFQPAKDTHFALLSPDIIYIDSNEQDVNITAYGSTVDDKDDMTFRSDASWLTGKPKTINGQNVSRPFTAAENTAEEARAASILVTFVDEAGKTHTATVQIVQAGAKDDSILEALVDEVIMDPAGETLKIGFIAKDELSSALSSSAWLKATINADKSFVKLVAEPNTTGRDRKAYVTVKNSKKTALITVDQPAGATEFTILTPSKAISSAKQNVVLRAYCSEEFELADVKVSSDAEWLTLGTKEFGSDTRVVRVPAEAAANTTGDARTAVVTVTLIDKAGKTHQGEATVLQSPSDNILDVYVSTMVVPYLEIEDRLPIYDNATSVIARSSNASWLYASIITNENGTRDVKIKIAENETGEPRTGVVTVTAKFEDGTQAEKVITVFQAAKGDEGTPAPAAENYLFLAVDDVTLPAEASEETVNVFTNATNYTVEADAAATWLTATKGSVKLAAEANTGAERTAVVTVTATFADGEVKTETLNVKQLAPGAVPVTHYLNAPKDVVIDNDHVGGLLVTLNTDALKDELSVVVPTEASSWLQVSPYNDAVLLVDPTENTAIQSREAIVTVTATYTDGQTLSADIKVFQTPAPEKYLYAQESLYYNKLGTDGVAESVPVFTNVSNWTPSVTYTDGADWLTVDKADDATLSVKCDENNSGADREATITLSNGTLTRTISVKQGVETEVPNFLEQGPIILSASADETKLYKQYLYTNAASVDVEVPAEAQDWLYARMSADGLKLEVSLKEPYYSTSLLLTNNLTLTGHFADGSTIVEKAQVIRIPDPVHYLSPTREVVLKADMPSGGYRMAVATDCPKNKLTYEFVSSDSDWLEVETLYSENTGWSLLYKAQNNTGVERNARVRVTATYNDGSAAITKEIDVRQLAMPEPTPTPGFIECNLGVVEEDSPAVTVNVPFSTDAVSYTVDNNVDWISISNTTDVVGNSASFDVSLEQNDSEKSRIGVVTVTATFSDSSVKKYYLPVIQHAAARYLVVLTEHYDLDFNGTGTLYVPYIAKPNLRASDLQITINAPTGYSDNVWLETGSPLITSHSLVFKITRQNYSTSNTRTGTITIKWTDPEDSTHTSTYVVTVVQPRA